MAYGIDKFTNALEALENAENAMGELWNTLECFEARLIGDWHETETASRYKRNLSDMAEQVRKMLAKREQELLKKAQA